MSKERAQDLAALCTRLVRNGNDFPTVWNTLLKNHTLFAGLPQSKIDGIRTILEIRLITGERLVFDGDAKNSASNRACAYDQTGGHWRYIFPAIMT
jgi:hypothetical protein